MIKYKDRQEMFMALPPGTTGAEIGVYRGWFSVQILETPVRFVYLIDPWENQPPEVYNDTITFEDQEAILAEAKHHVRGHASRCQFIRDYSVNAALHNKDIPQLDWVYIDGNHSYESVIQDLTHWQYRLKPGGVLMGHDYTDGPKVQEWHLGVFDAVNDFCCDTPWHITALTNEELASYRLEK